MALPTTIIKCLDRLYDQMSADSTKEIYFEKISIGGRNYKIKMYRGKDGDGYQFRIDVIDRN